MGGQRKGDCQELFVKWGGGGGAHLSSEGSHHSPSMPPACLQNSISPVCGGGSPLADTLGTSQVLSSGLASRPDKQGVGGKGSKDVPPAWLLGQKGLTQVFSPPGRLLLGSSQSAMQERTSIVAFNTFLWPFESRNSDFAVWWLGGVWLATNCYVTIMLGCQ